jgi:hypothetical protein
VGSNTPESRSFLAVGGENQTPTSWNLSEFDNLQQLLFFPALILPLSDWPKRPDRSLVTGFFKQTPTP